MKNPGLFAISCAAINCDISKEEHSSSFFNFPGDDSRCKLWVIKCRRLDLFSIHPSVLSKHVSLCEKHFDTSYFYANSGRTKLKGNAVPTLFDFPLVELQVPRLIKTSNGIETDDGELPGGINYKSVNRVVSLADNKKFICGGPLLDPGYLTLSDDGTYLVQANERISLEQDEETSLKSTYAPVVIATVELFRGFSEITNLDLFNVYRGYTLCHWMNSILVRSNSVKGRIALDNCERVTFVPQSKLSKSISLTFRNSECIEEILLEREELNKFCENPNWYGHPQKKKIREKRFIAIAAASDASKLSSVNVNVEKSGKRVPSILRRKKHADYDPISSFSRMPDNVTADPSSEPHLTTLPLNYSMPDLSSIHDQMISVDSSKSNPSSKSGFLTLRNLETLLQSKVVEKEPENIPTEDDENFDPPLPVLKEVFSLATGERGRKMRIAHGPNSPLEINNCEDDNVASRKIILDSSLGKDHANNDAIENNSTCDLNSATESQNPVEKHNTANNPSAEKVRVTLLGVMDVNGDDRNHFESNDEPSETSVNDLERPKSPVKLNMFNLNMSDGSFSLESVSSDIPSATTVLNVSPEVKSLSLLLPKSVPEFTDFLELLKLHESERNVLPVPDCVQQIYVNFPDFSSSLDENREPVIITGMKVNSRLRKFNLLTLDISSHLADRAPKDLSNESNKIWEEGANSFNQILSKNATPVTCGKDADHRLITCKNFFNIPITSQPLVLRIQTARVFNSKKAEISLRELPEKTKELSVFPVTSLSLFMGSKVFRSYLNVNQIGKAGEPSDSWQDEALSSENAEPPVAVQCPLVHHSYSKPWQETSEESHQSVSNNSETDVNSILSRDATSHDLTMLRNQVPVALPQEGKKNPERDLMPTFDSKFLDANVAVGAEVSVSTVADSTDEVVTLRDKMTQVVSRWVGSEFVVIDIEASEPVDRPLERYELRLLTGSDDPPGPVDRSVVGLLNRINKMPITDQLTKKFKMSLNKNNIVNPILATRRLVKIPIPKSSRKVSSELVSNLLSHALGSKITKSSGFKSKFKSLQKMKRIADFKRKLLAGRNVSDKVGSSSSEVVKEITVEDDSSTFDPEAATDGVKKTIEGIIRSAKILPENIKLEDAKALKFGSNALPVHIRSIINTAVPTNDKVVVFKEKIPLKRSFEFGVERQTENDDLPADIKLTNDRFVRLFNVPLDHKELPNMIKKMMSSSPGGVKKIVLLKEQKTNLHEENSSANDMDNCGGSDLQTHDQDNVTSSQNTDSANDRTKMLLDAKITEVSLQDETLPPPLRKLIENVSSDPCKVMVLNDPSMLGVDAKGGIPAHVKELIKSVVPQSGKLVLLKGKSLNCENPGSIPEPKVLGLNTTETKTSSTLSDVTKLIGKPFIQNGYPILRNKFPCLCEGFTASDVMRVTKEKLKRCPEHLLELANYVLDLKIMARKLKKEENRLKKHVQKLKTSPPKIKFDALMDGLKEYLSPEAFAVVATTAYHNKKDVPSHGLRYPDQVKRVATRLLLNGASWKVYKYLSSLFSLPCKTVVSKYIADTLAQMKQNGAPSLVPTCDDVPSTSGTMLDDMLLGTDNNVEGVDDNTAEPILAAENVVNNDFDDFQLALLKNEREQEKKRKQAENSKIKAAKLKKMKLESNSSMKSNVMVENDLYCQDFNPTPCVKKVRKRRQRKNGANKMENSFSTEGFDNNTMHSYSKRSPHPAGWEVVNTPSTSLEPEIGTMVGHNLIEISIDDLRRKEFLDTVALINRRESNETCTAQYYENLVHNIVIAEDDVDVNELSAEDLIDIVEEEVVIDGYHMVELDDSPAILS